jgi:hypothetical protein
MNRLMQIDSVAMLEILPGIERRFGIDMQEKELQGNTNLEQVIDLIHRKVRQRERSITYGAGQIAMSEPGRTCR